MRHCCFFCELSCLLEQTCLSPDNASRSSAVMVPQVSAMSGIARQRVAVACAAAVFAAPVVEALHHLGLVLQLPAAHAKVMNVPVQFVGFFADVLGVPS